MNVSESIEKSKGETLFSFEILPPLKGSDIDDLFARIDPLMEFNPSFVNKRFARTYKKYQNQQGIPK